MDKMCKRIEKMQLFSGTTMKIVATIVMAVDHFSKIVLGFITAHVWFPNMLAGTMAKEQFVKIDEFIRFTLYRVGGFAFPLFCLLISEGYHHTHDRKKYIRRMCYFALISELPFDIGFFSQFSLNMNTFPFYWKYQNVFFTYFLSLLCLYGIDRIEMNFKNGYIKKGSTIFLEILCIAIAAGLADLIKSDYGAMGVLFIVAFYFLRKRRAYQSIALLAIYIMVTGSQPTIFSVLAAFTILLYNGSKGREYNKYFFYLFYPLHIIALYLITLILGILVP